MNVHGLRIFHAVAGNGGVSRAADRLHISQPAVTMQLKKFEQELGFPLTRTSGRGMELTEAGVWLAAQADRLFALEAEIAELCADYKQGSAGRLTLAATYLPANFLLPPLLHAFRTSYPQVEVRLLSGNARSALDMLLRFEADMAWIGGRHRFPEQIEAEVWREDELWFVAQPGHPLAGKTVELKELARCPFVMREAGSYTKEALYAMCRSAGIEPPAAALQVGGPQEALRAVLAGVGITLCSAMEAEEYAVRGALVRLQVPGPAAVNVISRCVRAGDPLSPQAKAFMTLTTAL